jgi:hypothetical protein
MTRFVRFTRPDGSPVELAAEQIVEISVATADYAPGSTAVLFLTNGGHQAVKETVAEVDKLLGHD